jgi:MoxR-like ATPase
VLVCLLADGHLLIEGVPGLAKMLTIKTTAQVLGGTFNPVFCNFLLADEINRAPAQVQSALLEVMQERQVTIGKETFEAPSPFLVMATQNPIESEGHLPAAGSTGRPLHAQGRRRLSGAGGRADRRRAHARALALIRGRDYVLPQDVRELASDALQHRIVLSYEALAAEVGPESIVDSVLDVVPMPELDLVERAA